jgi:hypothetical protein
MNRLMQGVLLTLPLLATAAPAVAADNGSPIPPASTARFLGNVPDYAGGRPSPNIIYSTRDVGEVANGPGASKATGGPSVVVIDSKRSSQPTPQRGLSGGTLERRLITPTPINPPPIVQTPITPYTVQSPWSQQ